MLMGTQPGVIFFYSLEGGSTEIPKMPIPKKNKAKKLKAATLHTKFTVYYLRFLLEQFWYVHASRAQYSSFVHAVQAS